MPDQNSGVSLNKFPFPLFLDKHDQGYEIKQDIFLQSRTSDYREFMLDENLLSMANSYNNDEFNEFMSYARFVAYEGDLAELYNTILAKKLEGQSTVTFLEGLADKMEIDPIDLQTE